MGVQEGEVSHEISGFVSGNPHLLADIFAVPVNGAGGEF